MNWYWLILALASVTGAGYLIGWANRESKTLPESDWFWGPVPDGWEWTIRWTGEDPRWVEDDPTPTEPNAPQESEPTSGAG